MIFARIRADKAARAHSSLPCRRGRRRQLSFVLFIQFEVSELFSFTCPPHLEISPKESMMRPVATTLLSSLRAGGATRSDPPHFRPRSTSCFGPLSTLLMRILQLSLSITSSRYPPVYPAPCNVNVPRGALPCCATHLNPTRHHTPEFSRFLTERLRFPITRESGNHQATSVHI